MSSHAAPHRLPPVSRNRSLARASAALAFVLASGLPASHVSAQTPSPAARTGSVTANPETAQCLAPADSAAARRDSLSRARSRFRKHFVLGFVTSILAHETGHVIAAYAVGGHPSFGFDKARPTIYSGIDDALHPQRQFIFSSAGLTVQSLLDEGILDVPHHRGSAFERGILAGGIGTVLFYTTIGRNGSVSDVSFMARTSTLSKTQISLIYGGIAALHAVRIHFNTAYAHFFTAPSAHGGLQVGMRVTGDLGQ